MGEPVRGRGSCMPDLPPTDFSEWEPGYISHVGTVPYTLEMWTVWLVT